MTDRQQRRLAEKHFAKLGDILHHFYSFLGQKNKPSDDEVRAEFIKCRTAWVNYATKNNLDDKTKKEFVNQVSMVWHKKMKNDTIEK